MRWNGSQNIMFMWRHLWTDRSLNLIIPDSAITGFCCHHWANPINNNNNKIYSFPQFTRIFALEWINEHNYITHIIFKIFGNKLWIDESIVKKKRDVNVQKKPFSNVFTIGTLGSRSKDLLRHSLLHYRLCHIYIKEVGS